MPKDLFKTVQGKRIKKTPEEIAEEERGGQEFIKQREQIAMQQGISSKEAARRLSAQTEAAALPQRQKELEAFNIAQEVERLKSTEQVNIPQQPEITQPQPSKQVTEPSGLLSQILKTRVFQPVGISGLSSAAEFIKNPQAGVKQALTETAIGAGAGLGAGALTAPAAVSTVSASVKSTSLLAKAFSISKSLAVGGGGIALILNKKVSDSKSILSTSLAEMEEINKEVIAGTKTSALAEEEYSEINQNINSAESSMKFWSSFDVFKFMGFKDSQILYERARRTTLPRLRIELDLAIAEARLSQAKINLGVPQ